VLRVVCLETALDGINVSARHGCYLTTFFADESFKDCFHPTDILVFIVTAARFLLNVLAFGIKMRI
jgi:hypothetical protein